MQVCSTKVKINSSHSEPFGGQQNAQVGNNDTFPYASLCPAYCNNFTYSGGFINHLAVCSKKGCEGLKGVPDVV